MSDTYYFEFKSMIVGDVYHSFLDLMANYCDSFSLCSPYGRQTWSKEDLEVVKKQYDTVSDASNKKVYKFIMDRHSENGCSREPDYLLQIPEYYALRNNLISTKACNLSGIYSYTRYTFKLNEETLNWLKQFSNIFVVRYATERIGLSVNKDLFNSDANEYELEDLSFEKKGRTVLYASPENTVSIIDSSLETIVDTFMNEVIDGKISEFTRFRENFEQIRTSMAENSAIDFLSKHYEPIMFSPLFAVYKFKTCSHIDKDIIDFYYDTANLELFAKTFVKSVEVNNNKDLKMCFSWLCEQETSAYSNVPRPLLGERIIIEYLKTVDKNELIKVCDEKLKDILLHGHDIYEMDKIANICISNGITADSFSPIIRELYIAWSETYSEYDYQFENHAKQFLTCWKYANKLKRSIWREHKRLYMKRFIKRNSQSGSIGNFTKSRIAYHYYLGFGIKKDYAKAIEWFKKVADNIVDCQYDLAKCYLKGWGTERDIEQAKYWFSKAAENGHPKAREQLDLIKKMGK